MSRLPTTHQSRSPARIAWLIVVISLVVSPRALFAQDAAGDPADDSILETTLVGLAGAGLGLAIHEGGHLAANLFAGTTPGVSRVSYAGIPFFAITHDPVSPSREFVISSAGFWMQHVSSEVLLSRRPRLRREHAPLLKGLLAFNVGVSVMYAGAALARTGPPERDTRGVAVSANVAEPWVAPVILAPAALDALRYFKPQSRPLVWASRAAKVGGVLLILRTRS